MKGGADGCKSMFVQINNYIPVRLLLDILLLPNLYYRLAATDAD